MESIEEKFGKAISLIKGARNILLVSHRRPDGDTLGASVALNLTLKQLDKTSVLACMDEIPDRFYFLP